MATATTVPLYHTHKGQAAICTAIVLEASYIYGHCHYITLTSGKRRIRGSLYIWQLPLERRGVSRHPDHQRAYQRRRTKQT